MTKPTMIGNVPVEVSPAPAPGGWLSVVLQVGDQWYLGMRPRDARILAAMLNATADEVEASQS